MFRLFHIIHILVFFPSQLLLRLLFSSSCATHFSSFDFIHTTHKWKEKKGRKNTCTLARTLSTNPYIRTSYTFTFYWARNFVILISRAATSLEHVFLFFTCKKSTKYWPNMTPTANKHLDCGGSFVYTLFIVGFLKLNRIQLATMTWMIVNYFRSKCKQEEKKT